MQNLGNVSGVVYASYPEQWDEVYVCHNCKLKVTKREHGAMPPDYSYLRDYKDFNWK